jgi:hypothetical protein
MNSRINGTSCSVAVTIRRVSAKGILVLHSGFPLA